MKNVDEVGKDLKNINLFCVKSKYGVGSKVYDEQGRRHEYGPLSASLLVATTNTSATGYRRYQLYPPAHFCNIT